MNKKAKCIISGIVAGSLLLFLGCSSKELNEESSNIETETSAITADDISIKTNKDDIDDPLYSSDEGSIKLNKDSIVIDGDGLSVEDNKVTITSSGTYEISGELEDGQIIVDATKDDKIKIILNGATIKSSNNSPIYIKSADRVRISLADGTSNNIEDGEVYEYADESSDEPNAAIFSKEDLIIEGNGSLNVKGNYSDGIRSKYDLTIKGGIINVTSIDNGIKGKDSVTIEDGDIIISAKGDGIKATNDSDEGKGYILVEGGEVNIVSDYDGIQAENSLIILDGTINIETGGGSSNAPKESAADFRGGFKGQMRDDRVTEDTENTSSESRKGLKSTLSVEINGGKINIDSYDDGIHTDGIVTINSGDINVKSGDDGIHAGSKVNINDGSIDIIESYEGIEGKIINITDGTIYIKSSDDGVNGSEGTTTDTADEGFGREPRGELSGNAEVNISGGYLYIDADGDGLDSNGTVTVSDGTVIINGTESGGNGAIDYDKSFNITGGLLVAVGSSEMSQAPDETSTQYIIKANLSSPQSSGTILSIKGESGEDILTFKPSKSYQSIVVSSPEIKKGESYTISTGGTATGEETYGLYKEAEYSGGTKLTTITVSGIITSTGEEGGQMPGGRKSGGKEPGGMKPEDTNKQ